MDQYLFISSQLEILEIFNKCKVDDILKLIMFIRDPINGRGEKDLGILLIKELKKRYLEIYKLNMDVYYNKYGCYKDILKIEDNYLELIFLKNQLEIDLINMNLNKKISLAAKWAPSENSKYHNIGKRLSKLLFPNTNNSFCLYRKNILIPLRRYLNLVETKMCFKKWDEISYVPFNALNKYKKAFDRHNVNYDFNSKSLYELVQYYLNDGDYDNKIEDQLNNIINNYKNTKYFNKTLPIINFKDPNKYIISIALIISECNNSFLKNKIINGTDIIEINGNTFKEKINQFKNIKWNYNNDINYIYKKLLDIIRSKKNAIDRYILFTDTKYIDLDFKIIKLIYNMSGYILPKLIYWNYNDNDNFKETDNIILISGESNIIRKLILDYNSSITNIFSNY